MSLFDNIGNLFSEDEAVINEELRAIDAILAEWEARSGLQFTTDNGGAP